MSDVAVLGDRRLFPDLAYDAYLNHAAVSPPSAPVLRATSELLGDFAARGVGAVMKWVEQRERLRVKLADWIGARAHELALVPNTSAGVIAVARCLKWRPGDRVVLFGGEFPTNTTPWQIAARDFDLGVSWVDSRDVILADGLDQLRVLLEAGDVRLVAVSMVEFQTGWRMPIEELSSLCHQYGAELFVDGIQACGVIPVDVVAQGIDYLAVGGHKWMMGLEGAGFLYVAERAFGSLEPRLASWLSHDEPLSFLFEGPGHLRYDRPLRAEPSFLEGGVVSAVGYAALEASVDLLAQLGQDAIFTHVSSYVDALASRLNPLLGEDACTRVVGAGSGILSYAVHQEGFGVADWVAALGERGVAVSSPDGHLRFAPHWPNNLDEVDVIAGAIEEVLATR